LSFRTSPHHLQRHMQLLCLAGILWSYQRPPGSTDASEISQGEALHRLGGGHVAFAQVMVASMEMQTFRASVSRPESIARAQHAKQAIERAGGKMTVFPPTKEGMTIIELRLPLGLHPDAFLPELPFYLV
jgi:hypothetical protein